MKNQTSIIQNLLAEEGINLHNCQTKALSHKDKDYYFAWDGKFNLIFGYLVQRGNERIFMSQINLGDIDGYNFSEDVLKFYFDKVEDAEVIIELIAAKD